MARTNQDWYNSLGPLFYYSDLCDSNNHELISLSGVEDGSRKVAKGNITFFCNKCNTEITTTVAVYRISKKGGCRECKKIEARRREAEKRAKNPTNRGKKWRRTWTNHSPIKTLELLKEHLHSEKNVYNLRMLELQQRELPVCWEPQDLAGPFLSKKKTENEKKQLC